MIDLKKAEIEFEKYTSNYDKNNTKIAFKIKHSYDVEQTSLKLSEQLKLKDEDILLAGLIGLLHDIGRFEQMRRYNTYVDRESVDHADLSMDILTENNFIRKFIEDNIFDSIILKAVKNHNKYKIEDGLDSEILLQSKIIRDADKIDILNLLVFETFETLYKKKEIIDEPITEKVLNAMLEGKQVERKDQKTAMDDWASNIGYIYDINFKPSFKILKEKDYINKIINRTKTPEMEKIRIYVNKYIDEKI